MQKQPVSRARAGYQKANEQAAGIIAGDPAKYPEGSLAAQWAAAIIEKQRPMIRGPLFKAA